MTTVRGHMSQYKRLAASALIMVATLTAVPPETRASTAVAPPTCAGVPVTLAGTAGDDRIRGTLESDVIHAGQGDDVVSGLTGTDVICGGPGDDLLRGQHAPDWLRGGHGHDVLKGGVSDDDFVLTGDGDIVYGAAGPDAVRYAGASGPVRVRLRADTGRLIGAPVQDRIFGVTVAYGSRFDDVLRGDEFRNGIFGLAGDDQISGFRRADFRLFGGYGDDDIHAGAGILDVVWGGPGADNILGGAGTDALRGEKGDDRIDGGKGHNSIFGGPGTDVCLRGETVRGCEVTSP